MKRPSTIPSHVSRIGLIAGEGELPVDIARNARQMGIDVFAFTIFKDNVRNLKAVCNQVIPIKPGLVAQNLALGQDLAIEHVVFAGKVNKWLLLRNPKLDRKAIEILTAMMRINDDAFMLRVIDMLEEEGLTILPQTAFLQNHFLDVGCLTELEPSPKQWQDIHYGLSLAKEMGRLDVGQTVVVKDGMVLAIEAIEGTDQCLKRAGELAKQKGGTVIKVAKPNQDQRFDVPTVGLRTLKTMKKAGLNVLAIEANETLVLDPNAMTEFANHHGITIVSTPASLPEEGPPFPQVRPSQPHQTQGPHGHHPEPAELHP